MNTNIELTGIPVILKFLSSKDFLLLDLRGEPSAERKDEFVKNLKELIFRINQFNREVNIVVLNTKIKAALAEVYAVKENIGRIIARETGIYGFGDYLFEPERTGFNPHNHKRNFNLYYYDYIKNVDLIFSSDDSYLDSLNKMKNDAYFYELIKRHSIFCSSCRTLIIILDKLPELPFNFYGLRINLREGHYLTDIYLELRGLKDKLRSKE